jgi:hypothetical protein
VLEIVHAYDVKITMRICSTISHYCKRRTKTLNAKIVVEVIDELNDVHHRCVLGLEGVREVLNDRRNGLCENVPTNGMILIESI